MRVTSFSLTAITHATQRRSRPIEPGSTSTKGVDVLKKIHCGGAAKLAGIDRANETGHMGFEFIAHIEFLCYRGFSVLNVSWSSQAPAT